MLINQGQWKWEEDGVTVVRSIARTGPGCNQTCGVLLYVEDGKLVKVEGDPAFPLNQGRLCPRCLAITQLIYHPDRLRHPLKRVGDRGEGKWERITWDEAYGVIAERFQAIKREFGAESIIFCTGTGRDISFYLRRLGRSFGSPNDYVCFGPLDGRACAAPKRAVSGAILGSGTAPDFAQSYPDRYENMNWEKPECILVWGKDPTASSPGYWIIDCMKRGSKVIVIDPRKTWLAARAEKWMQLRPGTDAALALGMLSVIIEEELYDEEFVQKWTHGFNELKEHVQKYSLEKISEITWISEQEIRDAARMYARSKPASTQWGVAIEQSKECVATIHAIISLWAVTGNLDIPGGNVISGRLFGINQLNRWGGEFLDEGKKNRKIGFGRYPFYDWANAPPGQILIDQILTNSPYPIKAAWIQGTNTFACGTANPRKVYDAFKKVDFNVVIDLFMTPTAMAFADIVLPTSTYVERDGLAWAVDSNTGIGTINKAIEPVGECKSDMEINLELGKMLNPGAWPWNNVREMFDAMLASTSLGMTFKELRDNGFAYDIFEYKKHENGLLREDGEAGFNTPTGKVELYSTIFEKFGLEPLPYYEEPPQSPVSTPEVANEYPLVLTTGGRMQGYFHSEHRQISALRALNPDPVTEIHPETAQKLGIKDGDWVYIESSFGKCRQKVKISNKLHPGVVHSQNGWWFPEKPGPEPSLFGVWESNINLLLPSGWTGKSGFGYPFKNQMCRVYKSDYS